MASSTWPTSRRFAVLWLPYWQTDRLRAGQAEASGREGDPVDDRRPLVTWLQDGPRMVLSAVCPVARRLGLDAGMSLARAQAMIPELAVRPAWPEQDAAALSRLAVWCLRYTPHSRAAAPDCVWLDLSGCAHLFGGESTLLEQLAGRLRRSGLSLRAAIAPTIGAAHALARHGEAAFCRIEASALPDMLAPLPVEALRLEPEQRMLLDRFGLHRIGDLLSMPRGPLARRLGPGVLLRLDQATGQVPEPLNPDLPSAAMQERLSLAQPLITADGLAATLSSLLHTLCRRLEAAGLGARRIDLLLVRLDGSCLMRSVTLSRPGHQPAPIRRLLDARLEQVDLGEGVETLWLTARLAEPVAPLQAGLPDRALSMPDPELAMAPLIDMLRNRLGADRLWRPLPVESDVPERSVGRDGMQDGAARMPPGPVAAWPDWLPRPIRLIEPPQPVNAMAGLPDHAPAFFVWRRRRHLVVRADGPERIAGEWWRRDAEWMAVRDYFRVEDEEGRRFWLFRRGDGVDRDSGDLSWFLHGLF